MKFATEGLSIAGRREGRASDYRYLYSKVDLGWRLNPPSLPLGFQSGHFGVSLYKFEQQLESTRELRWDQDCHD